MLSQLLERAGSSGCLAMLVFAHPDDEAIALGARLHRFDSPLLVHITDGAPRNLDDSTAHGFRSLADYRRQREEELNCALKLAGLEATKRIRLGIPDQEATLCLSQLTRDIRRLLLRHRPEVVFTHPYEGGHPDHDACTFAVHRAVAAVEAAGRKPPAIVEADFYHSGPNGMATGCFLPHSDHTEEICLSLSDDERRRRQALLACFSSQQDILHCFPPDRECFRIAPRYDFHRPPHRTPVFYDQHPWGMTSARFCELAREADALDREMSPA
ncbi:MAG: PIG-L family deacetylase [Silvibacterium sp.]|nr:PIG-L family deacetylase [Silvibacterium sp.]MBV8437948.1 PIG-L family deacetylase [Silvibacterium sp.]